MSDRWIWVVRKANNEEIKIVETDFDPELYDLVDTKAAPAVEAAVSAKKEEAAASVANAEQLEKNASAKKGRGGKKGDEK